MPRRARITVLALASAVLFAGCTCLRDGVPSLTGRAPDGKLVQVQVLAPPPTDAHLLPLVLDEKHPTLSVSAKPPGRRERHEYLLRPRLLSERGATAVATWSDTASGPEICFFREAGMEEISFPDGSVALQIYDYCATLTAIK